MSEQESAISPLLGSLMQDVSLTLNKNQQHELTIWSVKMAMVWEATRAASGPKYHTQDIRTNYRINSMIPSATIIWLGRCNDSGLHTTIGDIQFNIRGTKNVSIVRDTCEGYAITLLIGHLVIQVVSITVPDEDQMFCEILLPSDLVGWDDHLVSIYPYRVNVTWPPQESLTYNVGAFSVLGLRDRWNPAIR